MYQLAGCNPCCYYLPDIIQRTILEIREREVAIKEQEIIAVQKLQPAVVQDQAQNVSTQNFPLPAKYVYCVIETNEPTISTGKTEDIFIENRAPPEDYVFKDILGDPIPPLPTVIRGELFNRSIPHSFIYKSEVATIVEYSTDKGAMELDHFESKIAEKLTSINTIRDITDASTGGSRCYANSIIKWRKIFTFDSYSAASQSRAKD